MKFILQSSLILLTLSACVTPTKLPVAPQPEPSTLIFPFGRYRHQVELQITPEPAHFSFASVVQTSATVIHLVALSPFGTTLLKIHEDRVKNEVTFDVYEPQLNRARDKFKPYYALLRKLLLMPRGAPAEIVHEGHTAKLTFSQWEKNIPRHILVEEPTFSLNIQVEPLDD